MTRGKHVRNNYINETPGSTLKAICPGCRCASWIECSSMRSEKQQRLAARSSTVKTHA
jgi:hypothetical protein